MHRLMKSSRQSDRPLELEGGWLQHAFSFIPHCVRIRPSTRAEKEPTPLPLLPAFRSPLLRSTSWGWRRWLSSAKGSNTPKSNCDQYRESTKPTAGCLPARAFSLHRLYSVEDEDENGEKETRVVGRYNFSFSSSSSFHRKVDDEIRAGPNLIAVLLSLFLGFNTGTRSNWPSEV